MDFMELAKLRYSCKKYSDRPVESELLNTVLEAGRLAPTARNSQPQRIYVAQSKEALEKIDAITPCRYGAPVVIIAAYDKNDIFHYPGGKYDSGAEDVSIVATQMMLAAASVGLDTCWLNFFDPDKAAELFGLPESETVVMLLDLGYKADGAEPLANHTSRKELSDTVKFI